MKTIEKQTEFFIDLDKLIEAFKELKKSIMELKNEFMKNDKH
jgi:hypothetical protein